MISSENGQHLIGTCSATLSTSMCVLCPVSTLSRWFASHEKMMMLGGPLFPGSNQQLRFNKFFWSFLNEDSHLAHACGCDTDLLGVHSFRKGALTFLSAGSNAGLTSAAIHQRVGWLQFLPV
jgi:hypothetical protein